MKVVARMVEVIGDDEWVDETIRRSVEGVLVILPGRRLIRSSLLEMTEITEAELATVEAKARPQATPRAHSVRIDEEDEAS